MTIFFTFSFIIKTALVALSPGLLSADVDLAEPAVVAVADAVVVVARRQVVFRPDPGPGLRLRELDARERVLAVELEREFAAGFDDFAVA